MSVPRGGRGGKYQERPAPCRICGAEAWWDGCRVVAAVVGVAAEYVAGRRRRRARCSDRSCGAGSWTVYEAGDYPCRTFQLDVVASAVVQGAVEGRRAAADSHQCSRRSVGRWARWCVALTDPSEVARAAVRLDADGVPPPRMRGDGLDAKARWVVSLWERLAQVLEARGVVLPAGRCGLQRLLCWQRERFGVVAWLTKSSPPLHVELGELAV